MTIKKKWPKKNDDHYQEEVIKIYKQPTDGSNGTCLKVARWIKNGTAFPPKLYNQEVYTDRLTKQRKTGDNKALTYADVKLIVENGPEVLELLFDSLPKEKSPREERLPYSDGIKEEKDPFLTDEELPF